MKAFESIKKIALVSAIMLAASALPAQETNQIDALKRQLQQMQETFDRVQREQRQQIEALTKKLDDLTKQQSAEAEKKKLEQELAAELQKGAPGGATNTTGIPSPTVPAWSPAQPLTIARAGSAYMNLSFDALMDFGGSSASDPSAMLELGDHDPIKRGFSLRNAEIAIDGAVDPYFKGFANIVFKLDKNNETEVELEETYFQSTSLPGNLQVKGGQFFAPFGRQNSQHPHQWAFVDEPIILNRTLGPDGLRSIGAQVSWIAPPPFYPASVLGVFDRQGGTAFSFRNPRDEVMGVERVHGRETVDRTLRGAGDLLYVPHLGSSFDLTEHQTLVAGASAAFGPNDTGSDRHTEINGVDLYWKCKSPHADAGFPFVSWQTEALLQNYEAGADASASLPAERLRDWGFYTQVLWGFKPRWVTGLRGEYADGNTGAYDASEEH